MEANIVVQSNVAPTNLNRGRPVTGGASDISAPVQATPAPAAAPARPQPAAPSPSVMDITSAAGTSILSAHPNVNQLVTEDLIAVDIPTPFNDRDVAESVISRYIDRVNTALELSNFRLNFDVHEATNRVMVQVIDTNTDEILREIPPETRLEVLARIQEFSGLLFDARN